MMIIRIMLARDLLSSRIFRTCNLKLIDFIIVIYTVCDV